ncbi:amidohydrolase family protein [Phenylobacterium montanum]|uniref:Amidohydrolase family protein n=1 Tax=Phenylobacterium montanum TaxID=2823693 RepID=A0A975G4A7_9CAUL|nr:amidohydrolase family protein [Caulobacter sp. S6]QUD90322.1 amidohydrolase family protein [Caulobacter sp. S6]
MNNVLGPVPDLWSAISWRPRLVQHRQLHLGRVLSCLIFAISLNASPACAQAVETALEHARIYPSPDAAPISDGTILIRGGKIAAVGPADEVRVPGSARVIDATGEVVAAGFWNSHVHIMPTELLGADKAPAARLQGGLDQMLNRWGFTTVFDIASATANTLALRRRIESGEIAGPKILTVGDPFFPEGGTPIYVRAYLKAHGWQDEEVSSPEAAAARARSQLDRGTDGVKIFAGAIVGGKIGVLPMRTDIAKAVVAVAHRRGKPAFAHPSNFAGINVAIDSGVDVLAHTTAMEGGIDQGPWPPEMIARMRAHNMALIPTLMLFDVEMKKEGGVPPEAFAATFDRIVSEVRDYAAAGGQILFGTDVGYIDAYDTTEEFQLLSRALDWRMILKSLTTAPAERFGFADRKGRLAPGMDADLVVLDGDPAKDATAFSRVRTTIREGRIIWGGG